MKTVNTSWGEMAYLDSGGSGCPLLFLHGTGCDLLDWISTFEKLVCNQHYLALDFRGHGRSSVPFEPFTIADLAEDVLQLVKKLEFQETILVGHSLGGMVAMDVARHTSCVVGLILLEGWTSLSSASSAFNTGRFYGSLSKSQITNIQQKSEETRNRFTSISWEEFWSSVKAFDAYEFLENACIPIYKVFGGIGKNSYTKKKLRIPPNPNIRTMWVPNGGHYLPHECSEEVAEICSNFIATFFKNR